MAMASLFMTVYAVRFTHILPQFIVFQQAIEGFGTLRLGKWSQMMVPIREMTDVMKVVKEVVSVKPRQWVRLKRGIYKDDLAQVMPCLLALQGSRKVQDKKSFLHGK